MGQNMSVRRLTMVCCCRPGRKRELFRSKVGDVSSGNEHCFTTEYLSKVNTKVELCNDSDPALLRKQTFM